MQFAVTDRDMTLTATAREDLDIFSRWPQAIVLVRNADGTGYQCAIEGPNKKTVKESAKHDDADGSDSQHA